MASRQRKREILTTMSNWRVQQGSTSQHWTIYTDWSKHGQGYVLLNDQNQLVLWNSKRNSEVEARYSSELGETAAAVWALSETISFWRSAPIQICSDSKDFLLVYQNPQRATDPRLLRRLDYLLTTPQLKVTFVPGEYNHIADMFSRISDQRINATSQIFYTGIPLNLWLQAHRGHFDATHTYMNLRKLTSQFTFQDVVAQLRTCKACQQFRRRRPIDPLGTVADPTKPGEVITCDFLGRLPKGHGSDRYILSIMDYLSRWPAIGISSAANTSTLIEGLEKWISHFGKPRIILCDPVSYQISRRFRQ